MLRMHKKVNLSGGNAKKFVIIENKWVVYRERLLFNVEVDSFVWNIFSQSVYLFL